MRLLVFLVACGLSAQTISIVTPGGGTPTIADVTTYSLTCSFSSISNARTVAYLVDQIPVAYIPTPSGTSCPPYTWNPFDILNGRHEFIAKVYDATGTPIATSAAVIADVTNTITLNDGTGTVAPTLTTTDLTGTLSGVVAKTFTFGGTGTNSNTYFLVNGKQTMDQQGLASTFNTTIWPNGSHLFTTVISQNVTGGVQQIASWQRNITISNSTFVLENRLAALEVFLTDASPTYTNTGTTYYNDSTTPVANTTKCFFPSGLTTGSTVVSITGNCNLTKLTNGTQQIYGGTDIDTGTALQVHGGTVTEIFDATKNGGVGFTLAANAWMVGKYINITAGTGFALGRHLITDVADCGSGKGCALFIDNGGTLGSMNGSYAVGPAESFWVYANSTAKVPHFTRNGLITTTYSPTASIYQQSYWNISTDLSFTYTNWPNDLLTTGFNTIEFSLCNPWDGLISGLDTKGTLGASYRCLNGFSGQGQWEAGVRAQIAYMKGLAPSHYFHHIGDNWFRGDLYYASRGVGSAYTTPAWQYAVSQMYSGSCTPTLVQKCYGSFLASDNVDETSWRMPPGGSYAGGLFGSTNGPTQIVSDGSSCTMTCANCGWNPTNHFLITGATTTGFNLSSPNVFTGTYSDPTLTFSCSVGVGTYNAGNNPTLAFHPYAFEWVSGDYAHYDAMQTITNMAHAASPGYVPQTWAPAGNAPNDYIQGSMRTPLSDFASIYDPQNGYSLSAFLTYNFGYTYYLNHVDFFRRRLNYAPDDQAPYLLQAGANTSTYNFTSGLVTGLGVFTINSTVGNLITLTANHNISNPTSGFTRGIISGASVSADNGNYYIWSSPTAKSFKLAKASNITGTTGETGLTVTFQNGDVDHNTELNAAFGAFGIIRIAGACSVTQVKYFDQTFVASGSANGWNGRTFQIISALSDPTCTRTYFLIWEIPTLTSVSGTLSLIPDNYIHRGITTATGSIGKEVTYVSHMVPILLGAAGARTYHLGMDPQYTDPVTRLNLGPGGGDFNSYTGAISVGSGYQFGSWAPADNGGSQVAFYSPAAATIMAEANTQYLFQPKLKCPSLGEGIMCAARGDGGSNYGNILIIQSFWAGPSRTITVSLSAFELPSKIFYKYYCLPLVGCTVTSIAAGTATDNTTCDNVCTVWYKFPTNPSTEVTFPLVAFTKTAVTGTNSCVVRWAQLTYPIKQAISPVLLNTTDLGTTCSGTIPADPALGTIYKQLLRLNSAGAVISSSSVFQ